MRIFQTEDIWIRNGTRVNPHRQHRKIDGVLFEASLKHCSVSPSSFVMHPEVVREVGYFNDRLPACEDYDFFLRVSLKYRIGLLTKKLIYRYQGHDGQLSFRYAAMDRFRIQSLLNLYKNLQRLIADPDRISLLLVDIDVARQQIVDEIIKRARIIYEGAWRRRLWF